MAAALSAALLALAGCRHAPPSYSAGSTPPPPPLSASRPSARHDGRGAREEGAGEVPVPAADALRGVRPVSTEVGLASWYGPPYHNRKAADGSVFDQNALTAAHRTLPMGTVVRVTNLETNESVIVKITDRGPFVSNRILDLSLAAAKATGLYRMGVARVRVEAFGRTAADGKPEQRPDDGGRWCVQIGAFINPEDSVQLKNDLLSRYGKVARVTEFAGPTGHWVRINPLQPDHATAQRIADSIHIPDADPYLVRLN